MNGAPSNAETPGLVASAELDRTPMARFQQCPVTDRLLAPLVHQDGGAEGVKRVREECEVVRAPEQRTALHHHSLDHGTR